jgi:soluble lytic murein transglycosylase-like protein
MALSRREVWSLTFLLCALLIAFTLIWLAAPARAQERGYTADDTLAAIWQYSIEQDVSYAWLYRIVKCESGGDFNPYARGRQGELGAVQLHPRGELLRFYAWGYDDPFSPYQSVRFLAQRINQGGARAWSCR